MSDWEIENAAANLIGAIDKRWNSETERKRSNAISPWMEEELAELRRIIAQKGIPIPTTSSERHDTGKPTQ